MVRDSIAIIPARGGSKRLPQKNILPFFGKPLIAWTIEAALKSSVFAKVIVSTDDHRIAKVSREYGADVPFFRETAVDDFSAVSEATRSALIQAEDYWDREFRVIVQLMPNCPLRHSSNICEAIRSFENNLGHSAFQISCFKFGWMNPWWAVKLGDAGEPSKLFPDALQSRSQDLPELYCPTGAIWIALGKELKEAGTFYGVGHRFEPIPWRNAVDIDDQEDFEFANAIGTLEGFGQNHGEQ